MKSKQEKKETDHEHGRLIEERLGKLEEMRKENINPYPYKYKVTDTALNIKEKFSSLKPEEHSGKKERVAGRIVLKRKMGKVFFITLQDEFEKLQAYLRKDDLGDLFDKLRLLDLGDYIGVEGEIFKTKTGEVTVYAEKFEILSKAIRPLPEKYHGLKDTELKYRKRYLDLIVNPESAKTFRKRIALLKAVREFLDKKGFLEVETPILHPIYGGAAAKPFTTFHNELKMNLYLRISPELYLKRLIVGGFNKVYDINKNFRNEGIDTTHNPEFTMLELYEAYKDYNDMMKLTEEMYEYVAKKVNGTTKSVFKGKEIDFKAPWPRVKMLDSIKEHAGIDAGGMSVEELKKFALSKGVEFDAEHSWGNYVQAIFEHFCEDKYEQPTFIMDHPKETTPLCKAHREDPRLIERFEPFCMGMELGNAYSELNNPIIQRKLLEDQARQLKAGNEEANPLDEDFIEAIEQGMPPTGGLGIGIDRMAMLLLGKESLRDVIFFPTMKPEK